MRSPSPRVRRVFPALLGAAALSLTVLPSAALADHTDVSEDDDLVTSVRWNGDTRYDTAAKLAVEGTSAAVSTPATSAVLATGENFPDALAGAYLSGLVGGPVLLTEEARLSDDTRERLTSDEPTGLREVETVYLMGGRDAIDAAVEDELDALGFEVVRLPGDTRIETAAMVATQIGEFDDVGEVDGKRTAIVARADDYPDALVAGAAARNASLPLLLTNTDELPDPTLQVLQELEIDQVILPGGPVAISQDVEDDLVDRGYDTVRIDGDTRRGTAVEFADFNAETLGFTRDELGLARGDFYADALTLSPFAGREGFSIVLTESPTTLGDETAAFLDGEASCTFDTLYVPGGPVAVAEDVEALARQALTSTDDCAGVDNEDPRMTGAYVVTADDATGTVRALPQPGDDAAYAIFDEEVTGDDALPQQFTHIAEDGTRTDATSVEFDESTQVLLGFPGGTLTPGEGQVEYKQAGNPSVRVYDLAGNDAVNDVVVDVVEETQVDSTEDAVDAAPGDGECATEAGDCTLRAAVQEANADPDFDVVTLAPGTYDLTVQGAGEDAAATGDLDVTEGVRIVGTAGAETTIVDADGLADDRAFDVLGGEVAVEGLTVTNGEVVGDDQRGGAIRVSGEGTTATLTSSVVSDSTAPQAGGGIENSGAVLHVADTTFEGNTTGTTPGNGGALHAAGGETHVDGGTATGNSAREGGAFWVGDGRLVVDGTTFDGNQALGGDATEGARQGGGAVFNVDGILEVSDATFTGNLATEGAGSGGAILTTVEDGEASTDVNASTFTDNRADRAGGAIENDGGAVLTVTDATFEGNVATGEDSVGNGGAVHDGGSSTSINGETTATGNTAVQGGALWTSGAMTVDGATLSNNDATDAGTALYNAGGTLDLVEVTATTDTALADLPVTAGIPLLAQDDGSTTDTTAGGNTLDDGQGEANATCTTTVGAAVDGNTDDDGTCFEADAAA